MKENLSADGVTLHKAAVENPGTIGTVERYNAPLIEAFPKLRSDLGSVTTDRHCLQLAVFAVNATIGPEGLCPMLLVFGALPRPARRMPSKTKLARSQAIEMAMTMAEK